MNALREIIQRAIERREIIDPATTTAYRLINDAGDHLPGIVVDHLGQYLLIQSATEPKEALIDTLHHFFPEHGIYFKQTTPFVRGRPKEDASARAILSPKAPLLFPVLENGLPFLLGLSEGYSYGLFLDQRDNRRCILKMDLKGKTVLNTFAYTCAFSVCAARAGAIVTSLDLSKKYLERGRENFRENHIDDTHHDFIFGDVFDWLPRLSKKRRRWDIIILDPPTFSTAKSGRLFSATRDYPKLLALVRHCLAPQGRILACMNAHDVSASDFQKMTGAQTILPLPVDFPLPRGGIPHLKSGWIDSTP